MHEVEYMDTVSTTENGRAKPKPNKARSVSAANELQYLISERIDALKRELPPEHFALLAVLEHEHPKDMAHIIPINLKSCTRMSLISGSAF